MGGGGGYFYEIGAARGGVAYGLDISSVQSAGYTVISSKAELDTSHTLSTPLAGIFGDGHMPYEFSKTIDAIEEWSAGRDNVLIVVTADHETGGLTVLSNNGEGTVPDVSWSTDYHTAVDV